MSNDVSAQEVWHSRVRGGETQALQIKIGTEAWQPKINRLLVLFLRDMRADRTGAEHQLKHSVQQHAGTGFRLKLNLTQFLAARLGLGVPTYREEKPDSWSEVRGPTSFKSGGKGNRSRKTTAISTARHSRSD